MSPVLLLSACLLGGEPTAISGNAYYIQGQPPQPIVGQYSGGGFGTYETHCQFDGAYGWGYPTGNYSGTCQITRRSAHNMGIWDTYCQETSICGCCGYENGSYAHIMFCESRRKSSCGQCGHAASNCGCSAHGYSEIMSGHEGHEHGVIIEQDAVPAPPAIQSGAPAAEGSAKTQGGRYDDFLLEPGEERVPANAPWIRNTNLRGKPATESAPLRNWLFPRSGKPELPPITPELNEKITDKSPTADPFFGGQKK